ncbi:MAG TPA: ribosome-binding factor A [Acidimicrobiales bacterium]|nr:ribosome-binding factor A [Acidimicrobiales bacterium]
MSRRHSSGAGHRYPRTSRINEVMREVLAEAMERLSDQDERLSMATITGVTVEPDLRHAVVYLSSLSDDRRQALDDHRVELQGAVARQMRLKRTPRLGFDVDPAVVAGAAVDDVLRRLHQEQEQTHGQGPGDGEDGR